MMDRVEIEPFRLSETRGYHSYQDFLARLHTEWRDYCHVQALRMNVKLGTKHG